MKISFFMIMLLVPALHALDNLQRLKEQRADAYALLKCSLTITALSASATALLIADYVKETNYHKDPAWHMRKISIPLFFAVAGAATSLYHAHSIMTFNEKLRLRSQ